MAQATADLHHEKVAGYRRSYNNKLKTNQSIKQAETNTKSKAIRAKQIGRPKPKLNPTLKLQLKIETNPNQS